MPNEPESLNQLARRTGLPVTWIRQQASTGNLPCLRVGSRFLFSPAAVNETLLRLAEQGQLLNNEEGQQRG